MLRVLNKLPDTAILRNRGCGIGFVQRRGKIPFDQVPPDSWFLKEKLCDKIAIDIAWSQLEPEEGVFLWDQPEWEGCFRSWVDAGFKVLLKVRGMDTLGTFYNQGTPQWVFDAGAQYVDEPIEFYRNTWLLNEIPGDTSMPVRYPVYWDSVYLEKAAHLIRALGERYNGKPFVESVAIAHIGRWGEMHIADHYPRDEWERKGYSIPRYLDAHRTIIDLYRSAFPDTPLQQSVGDPSFQDRFLDAMPSFEYLAKHHIMLKCGGLGKAWHPPFRSPWLDDDCAEMFRRFFYQSKVVFENLVLSEALEFALDLGMSYWQRGGEAKGLGELQIEKEIPVSEKKIYSCYRFTPEAFDALSVNEQMELWRHLARRCGYRIAAEGVECSVENRILHTEFFWRNRGAAPCYEKFRLRTALCDSRGTVIWSGTAEPSCGCGPAVWDRGASVRTEHAWTLPPSLPGGDYSLLYALELCSFAGERMALANAGRTEAGFYPAGIVSVSAS